MKRQTIIILTVIYLLTSCNRGDNYADKVKFNSNGDTLEVKKFYPSDSIKEIIFYQDNKPVNNIGFYPDGDTIKVPYVVYTKQDSNMFIFIPSKLNICSYDMMFGIDSALAVNQTQLDKFNKLTDSLHAASRELTSSIDIKLNQEILKFGVSKGILRCKMDTGCKVFKFYPFDLNNNKNYR